MLKGLFGTQDIILGLVWMLVVVFIGTTIKNKNQEDPNYRWFMRNLWFNILFAWAFAATHVFVIGGGDTVAYWDGAVKLNKLFFVDAGKWWTEMITPSFQGGQYYRFTSETGFPPGWIYRESESFFVSKVYSVFSFFTPGSYIGLNMIISLISALSSFRLFQLVRKYNFCEERYMAIATMFIPTVAFYCATVSKDALIYICLNFLLYHIFAFIDKERKASLKSVLLVFFFAWMLTTIRSFMLIAVAMPLVFAFGAGYLNRLGNKFVAGFFKFLILVGGLTGGIMMFTSGSVPGLPTEEYLEELAVIQQDFAQNVTYGGPRYDLGITDYSPVGMLSRGPLAIITALYRPFIWEARSLFLILSGLEGLLLLYLTFRFFFRSGNLAKHLAFVTGHEFLLFSLIFVLFLGFFVGFTAGLFNVLVRFKAPLLGFLVLVLSARREEEKDFELEK